MRTEQSQFKALHGIESRGPSLLGRILGVAASMILLAGAFVFSLFLFIALAAVGLVVGGYVWWKTRELRKQMRAQMEHMQEQMNQQMAPASGVEVIEGEYVREEVVDDGRGRQ
ncbi:MAG: hypothetical protein KIS79_03675 [Burkholderiales bacterium]|nr:hypothetical protein [Burkholderiales bacterium]